LHEGQKGYVLTITSKEEENFIQDLLKANQVEGVWLGAHDSQEEGEWRWNNVESAGGPEAAQVFYQKPDRISEATSQEKKLYSNWRQGEPNDSDADEDCAVLTVEGWNDVRCALVYNALVVEFGSELLPQATHISADQSNSNSQDEARLPDGIKQSHEEL